MMGKIAIIAGLVGTLLLGACSDTRRSAGASGPTGFYGEFGTGAGR